MIKCPPPQKLQLKTVFKDKSLIFYVLMLTFFLGGGGFVTNVNFHFCDQRKNFDYSILSTTFFKKLPP